MSSSSQEPFHTAEAAPEPRAPQGEYAASSGMSKPAEKPEPLRQLGQARREEAAKAQDNGVSPPPCELLSPAGGPDCGYAAFWYGADAIYLGLKKFSARAEAENFTLSEVEAITAFAHAQTPPRKVFVTINTIIRQDEILELIEALAKLEELGVDALIIQDLGVYFVVREHFPDLALHASTQLAVHNLAGAETLRQMGFQRAILARELTLEEIAEITRESSIETEVFVHGALCYAYSGLCLFSSQTLGRSGNRGQCAYSCRDAFEVTGAPDCLRDGSPTKRDPRSGFPFSMKDLALPDHLEALRASGVRSFKIEGRKKNALYVASTTEYYRRLMDGSLPKTKQPELEADLQTVFSRPWTKLFLDSHKDKEVADRDTVGHRGTPIGKVERVVNRSGQAWLRFRTNRRIEVRDGLQVDLAKLGRPFGFSIETLRLLETDQADERFKEAYVAPEGALVEVKVPPNYPHLPEGASLYCSSSQSVKQRYRFQQPQPDRFHVQHPIEVEGWLEKEKLRVRVGIQWINGGTPLELWADLAGPFEAAKEAGKTAEAFEQAFKKIKSTGLKLSGIHLNNPEGLFVSQAQFNALRRELVGRAENQIREAYRSRMDRIKVSSWAQSEPAPSLPSIPAEASMSDPNHLRWSIKVDRVEFLDDFDDADWADVDEVVVDVARDPLTNLSARIESLGARLGRSRIRLALPALTRKWEEKGLLLKIEKLRAAGWVRWEAGNLSAWSFLSEDPTGPEQSGLDLASDWSLYVVNRAAAEQLKRMGVRRFALSPEDGLANMATLAGAFPEEAVAIVYQDTPLFVAESCAYANLIGGCPGKENCQFESMELVSKSEERVTALDYHCRTIVLNQGAFCLGDRLADLASVGVRNVRADFLYRRYAPARVREIWQTLRAGRMVKGGHAANFDRGLRYVAEY